MRQAFRNRNRITFPAEMWDQLFRFSLDLSDLQIHVTVLLDGRVDERRLAKAVKLLVEAAPITGCRFVEGRWRARWEWTDRLDEDHVFEMVKTEDPQQAIEQAMVGRTDPFQGPVLHVQLIRSAEHDTISLNLNHMAGDGGGLKDLISLLSSIYTTLRDDPGYRPEPNLRGTRRSGQVLKALDLRTRLKLLGTNPHLPKDFASWSFPLNVDRERVPLTIFRVYGPERFDALRNYGREHGATLNDVILASYYRTLHALITPDPGVPLRVFVLTDWRRYLPSGKAGNICNLLDLIHSDIGTHIGSDFDETLSKVYQDMAMRKGAFPGLYGLQRREFLARTLPYGRVKNRIVANMRPDSSQEERTRNTGLTPTFSNTGALDPEQLNFDRLNVHRAFISGTINYPPCFQLLVSTCSRKMTFMVRSCDAGDNRQRIDRFLDLFDTCLPGYRGEPSCSLLRAACT